MSWIKDGLKTTQDNDERDRLAAERQLHIAKVRKAKARDLLDRITAAATAAIEEYRAATTGQDKRRVDYSEKPSGGFKLYKPYYPAASVEISLDTTVDVLRVERSFTPSSNARVQAIQSTLQLQVDDQDDLWVVLESGQTAGPEETVKQLLTSVLFAA